MATLSRIKEANKEKGYHWFSRATMRFFRSRVYGETFDTPTGALFVSSEQYDDESPRLFTIRRFTVATGVIGMVGEFQEFDTKASAFAAANRRARIEFPNDDLADSAGLRPATWAGK